MQIKLSVRLTLVVFLSFTLLLSACSSEDKKQTYVVSAQASTGGSIVPASFEVTAGQTVTFTLTTNAGYEIAQITGCPGTLSGNQFITSPITNSCQVNASFQVNLARPTMVAVEDADESLMISWATVPDATSYYIYLSYNEEIIPEQYTPDGPVTRFASIATDLKIDGLVNNLPYYVAITALLDNEQSAISDSVRGIPRSAVPQVLRLNDTGTQVCANELSKNLDCPVSAYPGQDAEYGRDALAQKGLLVKVGNGLAGFDFTKLASDGTALPIQNAEWDPINGSEQQGTLWSCVKDNVTGLIWEVKTADRGLRSQEHVYSWTSADLRIRGGENGPQDFGSCTDIKCDTASYTKAVNDLNLCGSGNWRLPTRQELASIVVNLPASPAIDTHYFPEQHTNSLIEPFYWTATAFANPMPLLGYSDGRVWQIDFNTAYHLASRLEFGAAYVRLVHNTLE